VTGYRPRPAACPGDNQKVGRVARQAVNGRGYHHVAGDEFLHQCAKLRPVGRGASDFLAEHFFASGRLELAHLSGFVLGGRRDAGIAVNHARIVHPKSASKKAKFIKAVLLMQKS
jgi:hypothetical protein